MLGVSGREGGTVKNHIGTRGLALHGPRLSSAVTNRGSGWLCLRCSTYCTDVSSDCEVVNPGTSTGHCVELFIMTLPTASGPGRSRRSQDPATLPGCDL